MKSFVTDKLNRRVFAGDIVVAPDGLPYQVVKAAPGHFNVWDLGRTPLGHKFDNQWFVDGDFRKVLESEKT